MTKDILPKELLDVLCCPACKSDLTYKQKENKLACKNKKCSLVYRIEGGIPIMLIEEAKKSK